MSTLGKNIVKLRVDRGMKQKALVAQTGLSQRYVSSVENDKVDPSLSTMCRMAQALGVTLVVLVDGIPVDAECLPVPPC